jgi:hypothetical protein
VTISSWDIVYSFYDEKRGRASPLKDIESNDEREEKNRFPPGKIHWAMISKSVIYNKLHFEWWSSNNRNQHTHTKLEEGQKKEEGKSQEKLSG